MNYNQLISLCNPIDVMGAEPNDFGELRQDSRKLTRGDVFIAIRGFQTDGHEFIADAIEKGASIVISEKSYAAAEGTQILQVDNTRRLIGPLAQAFVNHPADQMKVIGITGTNGKTTVATLIYQVLQQLETNPALLGTVGKRIGSSISPTSLTTADPIEIADDMQQMVQAGATHLVMEVSSHALDQQRVNGISFDVAAFTNLSHDHLDYHKNFTDYAHSKKKLFDSLPDNAVAIVNGDDSQAVYMVEDCPAKVINFSFTKAMDADCQILDNSTDGLTLRIDKTLVESPLMGVFNAYNIAEAFLICRALGFESESIARALKQAPGAEGRMEKVTASANQPVVLVDYAHTPDALENVLKALAEVKTDRQKLHVVFGCGGDRDKTKRPKMAAVAETHADHITVTSDNPRSEDPDAIIDDIMPGFKNSAVIHRITDRKKAIIETIDKSDDQSLILIAGKGHETYQEIDGRRHDFDDRKIARQALGNRNPKPAES